MRGEATGVYPGGALGEIIGEPAEPPDGEAVGATGR